MLMLRSLASFLIVDHRKMLIYEVNLSQLGEAQLSGASRRSYRFTTYQDARRVRLVDGLDLKQIFYEYHPLTPIFI